MKHVYVDGARGATSTWEASTAITVNGLWMLQRMASHAQVALGATPRVLTRMAGASEGFHGRPQEIVLLDFKGYTKQLGWTESQASRELGETIRAERNNPSIPVPGWAPRK